MVADRIDTDVLRVLFVIDVASAYPSRVNVFKYDIQPAFTGAKSPPHLLALTNRTQTHTSFSRSQSILQSPCHAVYFSSPYPPTRCQVNTATRRSTLTLQRCAFKIPTSSTQSQFIAQPHPLHITTTSSTHLLVLLTPLLKSHNNPVAQHVQPWASHNQQLPCLEDESA